MRHVAAILFLLLSATGWARTYSTTFSLTETPISETNLWINGDAVGLDWRDVKTENGVAWGPETGSDGYDDPTALVAGSWGPDQTATAIVYIGTRNNGITPEVELRLRSTITKTNNQGYEFLFSCVSGTTYAQIVRWNGGLGDFDIIGSGSITTLNTGDEIKATAVGDLLTLYLRGSEICHVNDSTFTQGKPGIGFYCQSGAATADHALTSFTATDGLADAPITYYVSPTGNDGNTGLTSGSPWTATKGLGYLAPDVTVIMLPGSYTGPVIVDRREGTYGHPWILQSSVQYGAYVLNSASQGVRLDNDSARQCQYGIIDGLWVSNSVNNAFSMGGNMIVRNCKATGGAATTESLFTMFPITVGGSVITGGIIEDCIAENATGGLYHGFYYACGMTVRRCISRNNGAFGFHNYTGSNSYTNTGCLTYDCLSYGNTTKYGAAAWNADGDDGSRPGTNYWYNNTFLDGVEVAYGSAIFTNCIILNSPQDTSNAIHHSPGRTCTVVADYNMSTNSLAPDNGAHDVTGDPMFVGGGDYRLTSGSDAISAAVDLSSLFTTDLLGTTRPQGGGWDIGAYEFIAAPAGGGSGEMHVSGSVRARSISTP